MKFKSSKLIWILIIISLICTAIVYPKLPQIIPTHWDWAGRANQYGNKKFIFLTALIPLGIYALAVIMPLIDPKRESYKLHKKAYTIFIYLIIIFLIGIHWVSIAASLNYNINMNVFCSISIGILFIVLGNYMSQIRHNYSFGIKTPWTLANETVWTKTHRLGGILYIISGALFIITVFINSKYSILINIGFVFFITAYLFVYSYFEFRKLQK